jgi:SWIB-domain-containing proteins implicated in chromatin remodeling
MVKALQKRTERDMKAAQKSNRKRRVNGTRAPSGFLKPAVISDDLANFLGRPKGSVMSRKDVTKEIDTYVKAHNLQDPANRRTILPDKKLRSLFNIGKTDSLTYFNLQHYMKTHFTPDETPAAKPADASTTA